MVLQLLRRLRITRRENAPFRLCSPGAAALETTMQLIAVYLVFIVIGDFIAYGIGTAVQQVSESASLPIFLALYFFVFFIAWVIAVRVTAPRKA
jgi:hypothetical protein